MIVILCEESLTMEAYLILPALIKAIDFAKSDKEQMLLKELLVVCDLLGRYFSPDTYVRYILPRISGDPSVVQFATDAASRCTVLEVLGSLLAGSRKSLVADRFIEIADVISDPFIISYESMVLRSSALKVWETLLDAQMAQTSSLRDTHYALKGRAKAIKDAFKSLLVDANNSETRARASLCLKNLSVVSGGGGDGSIESMFTGLGCEVLDDIMLSYEVEGDWSPSSPQHLVFETLVRCPYTLRSPKFDLSKVLRFMCSITSVDNVNALSSEVCATCLLTFASILCHLLKFFLRGNLRIPTCLSEMGLEDYTVTASVTQEMQSKLSSTLSQEFGSICNAFVFDMRWNYDDNLQQVRFSVIEELRRSITTLALEIPRDTLTLNILENIIPSNLKPDRVAALRIRSSRIALDVVEDMTDMLQLQSIVPSHKLTSEQRSNILSLAQRFRMSSFIRVLVGMLSDCEDEIIETALQALTLALPFASIETDDEQPLLRLVLEAAFQLPLSLNLRDNLRCLELLDYLLRSAAAMNPRVFEDVLIVFESRLDPALRGSGGMLEFSCGLRDHIGMLKTLQAD